jgi:hypothetical protein
VEWALRIHFDEGLRMMARKNRQHGNISIQVSVMKKSTGRIFVANALVIAALWGSGAAMAVQVGVNVVLPVPVYAPPQPVYVSPQPVYAPPRVYVAAPPPVYAAAPTIVIGWHENRYWDGHRYWNRGDYNRYHGHGAYGHY